MGSRIILAANPTSTIFSSTEEVFSSFVRCAFPLRRTHSKGIATLSLPSPARCGAAPSCTLRCRAPPRSWRPFLVGRRVFVKARSAKKNSPKQKAYSRASEGLPQAPACFPHVEGRGIDLRFLPLARHLEGCFALGRAEILHRLPTADVLRITGSWPSRRARHQREGRGT